MTGYSTTEVQGPLDMNFRQWNISRVGGNKKYERVPKNQIVIRMVHGMVLCCQASITMVEVQASSGQMDNHSERWLIIIP